MGRERERERERARELKVIRTQASLRPSRRLYLADKKSHATIVMGIWCILSLSFNFPAKRCVCIIFCSAWLYRHTKFKNKSRFCPPCAVQCDFRCYFRNEINVPRPQPQWIISLRIQPPLIAINRRLGRSQAAVSDERRLYSQASELWTHLPINNKDDSYLWKYIVRG